MKFFDKIFDINFGADMTIMEEATELIERIKNNGPFPMFTSCCPGWVRQVENYYPELLDNFDPEQAEETYACPRTWDFANRLLASKKKPELDSLDKILLQSVIGLKAASDFYTFTRYYSDLPTLQEVEANPTQVPLPNEACAVWALVTSLVQQATDKNLDALIQCVTRCDISYQVVFVKMLLAAHKEYTLEPSVSKLVTKLGSKLN